MTSAKTATLTHATGLKKLTSRDLFSIKLIEDPRISPDGSEILFTFKSFDPEKNEYKSHLEIVPFEGGASRPFTSGKRDGAPRYSPDGKQIAFLRKVEDSAQLFVIPRHGGEARQVTRGKESVLEFAWSPDSKQIAFTAFVTEKGFSYENEKPEEELYRKFNADVKIINRIWYKLDGKGFLHDKRSQIFLVEIETGALKQLTFGDHDAFSPAFSPDGRWIAFASNRNPDSDYEPFSHIYTLSSDGGEPCNLTPGPYFFGSPAYSPDGKTVAFVGSDEPANFYANPRLWIVSSQGGNPECLTRTPDRPMGDHSLNDLRPFEHGSVPPVWSADGQTLYYSMGHEGKTLFISCDVKNKTVRLYGEKEGNSVAYGWDVAVRSNRAVVAKSDPTHPNDLWSLNLLNGTSRQITNVNADFLSTVSIVSPERLTARSKDGTLIEGWILKPPDFAEGKKYPAVLEIHGGPMAFYSGSFFFEFQLLANHGFVVGYSNPRGSLGYGQPFCEAIRGDWGNLDYQDVMAFTDAMVATGYVDEKKLGVAGGSYGGFMTNWVVGHTDRFSAGVTMRSVTSEYVMFGTSDYGFHGDLDMGCLPWEKPEVYMKVSPLTYVANIKTPLLILHAENDYRCPISQAELLYVSLKKLKRETTFIRFPDESHDLSRTGKPWHRIFRLDAIVNWFEKYLK